MKIFFIDVLNENSIMMLDLWMPFWWYNHATGGMTQTQLKEGRVMGSFEMFRKMILDNTSYYQPDVESIRFTRTEEYALFKTQDVKSFLAVPYSRRENGIVFLRNPKKFGNRPDMLRIISNILLQEINEQKHLDRMKINAAASDVRKDADVIVNLFGGIEIMTEQAVLSILTVRQRELFTLYYIEGYEMKEIARICGISFQAVSIALSESRKKLEKNREKIKKIFETT